MYKRRHIFIAPGNVLRFADGAFPVCTQGCDAQGCTAAQIRRGHISRMQPAPAFCQQRAARHFHIAAHRGKALRTGKTVFENGVCHSRKSLAFQKHRRKQRRRIGGKRRVNIRIQSARGAKPPLPRHQQTARRAAHLTAHAPQDVQQRRKMRAILAGEANISAAGCHSAQRGGGHNAVCTQQCVLHR